MNYPFTLGLTYALLEQYDKAIAALSESLTLNPFFFPSHVALAATYGMMGQDEEARDHLDEALKLSPQLTLDVLMERLPFKDEALPEQVLDALRRTGLN